MERQRIAQKRNSVTEVAELSHVRIQASADKFGWHGIGLEVGAQRGCNIEDVMVDGHCLFFNLAESALHFESRVESRWVPVCLPPRTFWINPEGQPFSVRHSVDCYWVAAIIKGDFLDSIAGSHHELMASAGEADDVLAHLMLTLVARLCGNEDACSDLDAELARVFVLALAKRRGKPVAGYSRKGGIAPFQLRSLLSWIEEHVGAALTIDMMASRVGLSAAHFSREFKNSTGLTPWGYILQLRLDRACGLLRAGESVSGAAKKCGFVDRSHLSRLFKQRFGVSPSAFLRFSPSRDLTG